MKWRVERHRGGAGEWWKVVSEHDFEDMARAAYAFAVDEKRLGGVRLVTPSGAVKAEVWRGAREPARV